MKTRMLDLIKNKCAPVTTKQWKKSSIIGSYATQRRRSERIMDKTAWRFATSFSMDLTSVSENEKSSLHPTRFVKRKIMEELENGEPSIRRESETSPTTHLHHHNDRDTSLITSPPHDHEERQTLAVDPNPHLANRSQRLQINPLDSPAACTRAAVRRLATTKEVEKTEENVGDLEPPNKEPQPKRTRGPTKMKTIAVEPQFKLNISFNQYGQPIGETSIGLASFLGSLVREVVPVNVESWKKLLTRQKEVLWHSIQARYNVNEDWQKKYIFQKMGGLWRASKSRLVSQIRSASNDEELAKLKPDNMPSMHDWMDFVKDKMSAKFTAKSEQFKYMKKKQLPHTCSRKGYARLAEDMKNSSSTPNTVTRVMIWTKAHMKKDGQPINSYVADTLERIEHNTSHETMTYSTNVVDDAISKVLGPDRGHVRGLGFGVTRSKLSLFNQKDKTIASLQEQCNQMNEQCNQMKSDMNELKTMVSCLINEKVKSSEQQSNNIANMLASTPFPPSNIHSPPSVTINAPHKCTLLDWVGSGEVIAEGRWSSNDPSILVHHIPLGPNAIRVWVDTVRKSNSYLWRPTSDMMIIDDAVGTTIAWPADKVKICE